MADIARFDNLVYTTLKSSLTTGATTINVNTASSPFSSPASAPTGELRALYIVDDPDTPATLEIVHYTTSASDGSGGLNLTGVTRNAEDGAGGAAGSGNPQAFSAGAVVYSGPSEKTMGGVERLGIATSGQPAYICAQSFVLSDAASINLTQGTDFPSQAAGAILAVFGHSAAQGNQMALLTYVVGSAVYQHVTNSVWTVGTTTEPGGSSDIAIWSPASTITVKNRIGSQKTIALFFLGYGD